MRTTALVLTVGLSLALLAGCGASDEYTLISPPSTPDSGAALDQSVADAMLQAGIGGVTRPQSDAPALVTLGEALFFDKILSGNMNISCATCHHPATFTGDSLPVSLGEGGFGLGPNRSQGAGALIPRNAPHIFNAGVTGVDSMFWDSRVERNPTTGELDTPEAGLNGPVPLLVEHTENLTSALAAQAMFPVTSHEEMRGQPGSNPIADAPDNETVWALLMERLVGTANGTVGGIAEYRTLFQAAYPTVADFDDLNFGHAARALAAFERTTWTALDGPFDRYLGGDMGAMSAQAKRGAVLYCGKAGCARCHGGPLLTDFDHHALAVPQVGPGKGTPSEDLGLSRETGNGADDYKFRTPQLRNVALTGPWMHAGAFATLEGAVRHHLDPLASLANYDASQLPLLFAATHDTDVTRNAARAAALSPLLQVPVGLTDAEFADLMAFLHALTDPASVNLLDEIPNSVPSGLPVID
ncbi:MAG: cytochrome-c peroxidase [Planctomycetota bacterium]|nr:cytochrome-c peroxidase [Planctomycetota bacterium]